MALAMPPPGLRLLAPKGLDVAVPKDRNDADAGFPSFPDSFNDTVKLWKRQASPADTCSTAAPNVDDVADDIADPEAHDSWCSEDSLALSDDTQQDSSFDDEGCSSGGEGGARRVALAVRRLVMLDASFCPEAVESQACAQPHAGASGLESDSDSDSEGLVRRVALTVRRLVTQHATYCPAAAV